MEPQHLKLKRLSREDAKRLTRRTRLDPQLYQSLVKELATLDKQEGAAIFIALPEDTRFATMKARIQRIAKDMHLTLTIRKTEDGLVVWKETQEEENHRLSKRQRTRRQTPD
jgi:hypothetical protein